MTTIARGNTGRLSVIFAPIVGVVDFADVSCHVISPSVIEYTLIPVEVSTNHFYADVVVDDVSQLGDWTVRWDSDPPSELITITDTYTVTVMPPVVQSRTTIQQVMERIRRQLNSVLRYEVSVLGSNASVSTDTLTLAYDLPPSLQAGAIVSVGTETCRVLATSPAAKELTVIRGFLDSQPSVHESGEEVWINPRFTANDIYEAMFDELAGWPAELFRVGHFQAAWTTGTDTIELPVEWTTMWGLLDARALTSTMAYVDYEWATTSFRRIAGRVVRGDPAVWSAGPSTGLYFRPIDTVSGGSILFIAALPFDLGAYELTADLVDDVGMQASMLDVLTLGVKIRLMPDQEIGRSQRRAQDDSRRAEEVPPEAALTSTRTLYPIYQRRRQEEIVKLRTLYPWRIE